MKIFLLLFCIVDVFIIEVLCGSYMNQHFGDSIQHILMFRTLVQRVVFQTILFFFETINGSHSFQTNNKQVLLGYKIPIFAFAQLQKYGFDAMKTLLAVLLHEHFEIFETANLIAKPFSLSFCVILGDETDKLRIQKLFFINLFVFIFILLNSAKIVMAKQDCCRRVRIPLPTDMADHDFHRSLKLFQFSVSLLYQIIFTKCVNNSFFLDLISNLEIINKSTILDPSIGAVWVCHQRLLASQSDFMY